LKPTEDLSIAGCLGMVSNSGLSVYESGVLIHSTATTFSSTTRWEVRAALDPRTRITQVRSCHPSTTRSHSPITMTRYTSTSGSAIPVGLTRPLFVLGSDTAHGHFKFASMRCPSRNLNGSLSISQSELCFKKDREG